VPLGSPFSILWMTVMDYSYIFSEGALFYTINKHATFYFIRCILLKWDVTILMSDVTLDIM